MNKKVLIPSIIAIAVLLFIGIRLFSVKKTMDERNTPPPAVNTAIPVSVAIVTKENVSGELVRYGNLIPNREADITSSMPGKIVSLNLSLGSYVGQGAVVARLDGDQQQVSLQQAQIARNKAEQDYQRTKRLVENDAAPAVQLQDAKVQRDNAQKQIEMVRTQMNDNVVRAPISGQVTQKFKVAGEYVNPGTPIAHVVDISTLKANVMVGEADAYNLKIGDAVTVTTDVFPGKTFSGRITFISNQGDATHNYPVEITLNNNNTQKLKAGTTVNVSFNPRTGGMMMSIPRTALAMGTKEPKVYVVENGKAVLRDIVLGRELGDRVEVISGLAEGAEIISSGLINIKDGSLVKVIK